MKNQPHGFSFFNNVAIATNYFVFKTKKKAVIIDWDIHHGEGTQNIFYNRNDVLYISLHRFDNGTFFPHIKQSGCDFLGDK
jgi:acetoin utilization deacetylase AcuC-like enzyme